MLAIKSLEAGYSGTDMERPVSSVRVCLLTVPVQRRRHLIGRAATTMHQSGVPTAACPLPQRDDAGVQVADRHARSAGTGRSCNSPVSLRTESRRSKSSGATRDTALVNPRAASRASDPDVRLARHSPSTLPVRSRPSRRTFAGLPSHGDLDRLGGRATLRA